MAGLVRCRGADTGRGDKGEGLDEVDGRGEMEGRRLRRRGGGDVMEGKTGRDGGAIRQGRVGMGGGAWEGVHPLRKGRGDDTNAVHG